MYKTGTLLTPQKLRRQLGELAYFEQDPDVGFHITDVSTATNGQGAGYAMFKSNGFQTALKNVLCGVNPIHGTRPNRLIVPAHFFSSARFTNQAGAEAAFLAAFRGINLLAPEKGAYDKIPVAQECEVEFDAEADVYIAGTYLTWVWDTTNAWIIPNKFKKTTDTTKAIARVVETTPVLPKTGTATRVAGMIKISGKFPFT